jgi:CheY-like chemotaxis protein
MVGGPATATAQEVLWGLGEADLIVSDLRLSGEDGLWLLEQVNQQPRPIPVVLVSGVTAAQDPGSSMRHSRGSCSSRWIHGM